MSESPQPESLSMYKQFEDASRKYYGVDKDPLRFVPAVSDRGVARQVALEVGRQLSLIDTEEITKQAESEQARYKLGKVSPSDVETNKQEILDYRLRNAVVNVETTHARLAPDDFQLEARDSGAYKNAQGYASPPTDPDQHK